MIHYYANIWSTVHEGDDPPPPAAPPAAPPKPPAAPPTKTFSQEDMDRAIQIRLRQTAEKHKELVGELSALRAKADLTAEERADFDGRIEQLNNTLLSTEELSAKEKKRISEDHTRVLSEKDAEIAKWQGLFTGSTIKRSITDAAIQHKAFHPEQLVNILDRDTRLIEELQDGRPTGKLVPAVKFKNVDGNGKAVVLDISPLEAVKLMTEMHQHQNLFQGRGTGGVGGNSHPDPAKQDAASKAKDVAAYVKGRRDGTITL